MGSGKSTVGRRVARSLGRPFFDSDELVEARLGRSIPDLFESGDEPLFRAEEAALIADLVIQRPPGVISLGGGALEDPDTRALVLDSTAAVHLDRPIDAILLSRGLRASRPLLSGRTDAEIVELYTERLVVLRSCPITVTFDVEGAEEVVHAVLAALAARGIGPEVDE
jgi:shikimate kinase